MMKTYKFKINGTPYEVAIGDINETKANVEVNGKAYEVELEQTVKQASAPVGCPTPVAPVANAPAAPSTPRPAGVNAAALRSPLPGTILSVNVTVGQAVKASDCVLVLEAMKMENNINAGRDGVVKEIYVAKGDNILEGAELALIE